MEAATAAAPPQTATAAIPVAIDFSVFTNPPSMRMDLAGSRERGPTRLRVLHGVVGVSVPAVTGICVSGGSRYGDATTAKGMASVRRLRRRVCGGPGISDPSHPGASALFDRLLQALRPDVGPVLLDVVEALRTGGLAENDAPAGRNVGEDRPQAVLVLVVDEHDKGAVVVIEGVDAHRVSLLSGIWNYPWSIPTLGQKAFPSSLDWETRALG